MSNEITVEYGTDSKQIDSGDSLPTAGMLMAHDLILTASGSGGIQGAICENSGSTTNKTVTLTGFTLDAPASGTPGSCLNITFLYTNSVAAPTLNVNSTGQKSIKYFSNGALNNLPSPSFLSEGQTYRFWYDGTYWVTSGPITVSYGSSTPTGGNKGDIYIQTAAATTVQSATMADNKTTWKWITRPDGLTECWGIYPYNASAGEFSSWGSVYRCPIGQKDYPVTFSEVINVQTSVECTDAIVVWLGGYTGGSTTKTPAVYIFRTDALAGAGKIHYHVVGYVSA